jgi:UDP-glucose 4-epimerase
VIDVNVLVTGGAGFIGSNLVEALVDEHEVTVLDNFHTGSMENLKSVTADIRVIEESCNDVLSLDISPEVIFHLGIPSSSPMYKENPFLTGEAINGMIAIMELAKRSGSKKVVFAASSSVYNGLPTPHREDANIMVTDYYTEARLAIERIAQLYNKLYDIDFAGLRFFSVYGPHEEAKGSFANMVSQFLWEMKKGNAPVIYGDGSQSRDFVFVEDVVDALILTSKRGTGIFNVGTGIAHSFKDVIDILNYKLDQQIEPVYVDNIIKNYVMHTQADTSKAKMLGFKAQVSLEEGIGKIVNTRRNYD